MENTALAFVVTNLFFTLINKLPLGFFSVCCEWQSRLLKVLFYGQLNTIKAACRWPDNTTATLLLLVTLRSVCMGAKRLPSPTIPRTSNLFITSPMSGFFIKSKGLPNEAQGARAQGVRLQDAKRLPRAVGSRGPSASCKPWCPTHAFFGGSFLPAQRYKRLHH